MAKTAISLVLKIAALWVILAVGFMAGAAVSGIGSQPGGAPPAGQNQAQSTGPSAGAGPAPTPAASVPPEKTLQMLLLVCLIQSTVLALVIFCSEGSGWKLIGAVFLALFGVTTTLSGIEAAVFLRLSPGTVARMFVMGAVEALMVSPAAVWLLGKGRRRTDDSSPRRVIPFLPQEWAWKGLTIAGAYVVLYFTFGYFVAWRDPAVRQFYGGTDPGSFARQVTGIWLATPWLFALQALRGLLFMLCGLPLVRQFKSRPQESALLIALLFSLLGSSPLLLPNPFMPDLVARVHLLEIASSNFLFGALVGWLLCPRREPMTLHPAHAASTVDHPFWE